ncbi:MAG: LamG-like jellyroll fold domain-containing protein [Bacteroidota bacterium]
MKLRGFAIVLIFFLVLFSKKSNAQIDSSIVLNFDFNDHNYREKNDQVITSPVGVSLVEDRFGNKQSALYLHGHTNSYFSLGKVSSLKPVKGTVSLWVNLERKVYAGCGYESNPILITKNSKNEDFNDAYCLFYDFKSDRFMIFSSKDSTKQAGVNSVETVRFNRWYHLVFTYDDNHIAFYVNGELQLSSKKDFRTKFDPLDSVNVGNGVSKKNDRYMRGTVDDIAIFHRVLTVKEIQDLYDAPNPNKLKNIFNEIFKYGIIILVLIIVIITLIIRNRNNLKKQKENFELLNKITELELKVIKAQMNPHFISNCLAAIQELIYINNIDKAGQYIAKFSYFLRQVLNYSDKNYITVNEEVEIIKLNVELEQLRFKNKFEFQLHIDEQLDANEILVPALITQPFIENAIWHGLLPLNEIRRPVLKITVTLKNSLPQIEIEDNGVGRDLNKLNNSNSKGTKLIIDKIESLNRQSGNSNHKLEIIDLTDEHNNPIGTRVIIHLDRVK